MAFATGETAVLNGTKLGIIRHTGNIWAAYVGNKKLDDSRSKREALKRIFEEIDMQGRLFE